MCDILGTSTRLLAHYFFIFPFLNYYFVVAGTLLLSLYSFSNTNIIINTVIINMVGGRVGWRDGWLEGWKLLIAIVDAYNNIYYIISL